MKKILFVLNSILLTLFSSKVDLTCSGTLDLDPNPDCGKTKYGYPVAVFFAKRGTEITAVGAIPTPTEVGTAMALATDARVIALNPISEGALDPQAVMQPNEEELDEIIDVKMMITGFCRYFTDTFIDQLRQLFAIRQKYQIWWVDNYGRWYGAKAGFQGTIAITIPPKKEFGHAKAAECPITVAWWDDNSVTYATTRDVDYLTLDNA